MIRVNALSAVHIIVWTRNIARSVEDIFISLAAYINRRSGKELISIAVKIRVSFMDPVELQEVIRRLQPIKEVKVSKNQKGLFKKAYIIIEK